MTMKGFTLVEALVAIAIVSIAIAGPMYSANRAIVAAQMSNSQLVATYLAQEGIEYIRSFRDTAYLYEYSLGNPSASTDSWTDFTDSSSSSSFSIWKCAKNNPTTNACTLDPLDPALSQCAGNPNCTLKPCKLPLGSGNDCAPLYLTSSNIYTQNNTFPNKLQPFTRTLQMNTISANEISVISTVTWKFHNSTYSVTATDHLTPWQ